MRTMMMVFALLLSPVVAQAQSQWDGETCEPRISVPAQADVENLYFSLAYLSLHDQREQMWALPSATKASLWTYNAERYLRNHPELDAAAQEMLRRGTALINTPAWFDIQQGSIGYPAKKAALAAFKQDFEKVLSPEIIYEVLIRLGPDPEATPSLVPEERPRAKIKSDGSMFSCSCGSGFDCGSSSSYGCFESWCIPTSAHCGPYGDESCWGRCKATD